MALGLTQPLAEMSNRNILEGGKGGRCVGKEKKHVLKHPLKAQIVGHEGLEEE